MAELVAEAFLSSLFGAIFEKLGSVDFLDYFRRGKLEKLVEKLESTLNSINQVLDDAEEKQYKSQDVKKWLGDVKHFTYEADQLLDEMATYAPLKKLKVESSNILSSFIPTFTNPFESRIKELLKNLVSLVEQKDLLGLNPGTCARYRVGLSPKPSEGLPTVSLVEPDIHGREGDKKEVINLLLSEENGNGNQVPVISIVGLGGMGKTTLAKLVYNDHEINEKFELKAWVYVSESYDVVGLTKAILRSLQFSAEGEDWNLLQRQLQQGLTGRKYLLVMDDVWNANWKIWEQLLLPFNYGSSGSRIIVTTRDKGVASIMRSTQIHHLKELSESNCWELFVRHAFPRKNVSQYPGHVSIGKKIVVKCGGLPLAIKALANLLHRKFSQSEWVKILETDMWGLLDGDGNINPVLRLSYHNLPSNLKRCFAYCSIFPKGYKFDKDEIIKLWMADGLLKCYGTEKSEEELGNEFFNDLESISFFQKLLHTRSNNKYPFVMHDLVNDLAKSMSGELCLRIEVDWGQHIPDRTRHIWCSIDLKDGERKLEHVYKTKGLRSLMVKTRGKGGQRFKICKNVQHDLFSRLKHLRMLSFNGCFLSELVDEIGNLQLLRYLNLSDTGITNLPNSICKLYNLQTLILRNCRLDELPSDFYKLVNLRHLDLRRKLAYYYSEDTSMKKMPKQIGKLNHLQMLTHFVVGEQNGSDIKELETLNHLQGTLHITGLENVTNPADAATANLKDKKYLEKLYMTYLIIVMGDSGEMDDSTNEMLAFVLEALQPNDNLNGLIIDYYPGKHFPSWLGGCHLPTLVSLDLRGCKFCIHLPPLGQLPSLKELLISSCDGIEIIGEEFYRNNNSSTVAFRSLEILKFEYLLRWKEWLCPDGCFPSLISLSIKSCYKLKGALPQHLPSLQKLKICDCEELEVSIPKATNIKELQLEKCAKILINEIPYSLKRAILVKTRVIESSLEQILLNNSFLEYLKVEEFDGANLELSSLDLLSCNSFQSLSITRRGSSCLPFALHSFTNLNHLNLYNCPQLESFPRGRLPPNLNSLWIQKCPKLIASREEWGLFELNSLKELNVSDEFENVESFPEEGLLPPTLNSLFLRGCSKLRVVNYKGLLHLESFKHFSIVGCPCLERLPEEGIPNSLSALTIYDCPLLKQRYQKEGGEHWQTISHIPTVTIDSKYQN